MKYIFSRVKSLILSLILLDKPYQEIKFKTNLNSVLPCK